MNANNLKATFFVCGDVWTKVTADGVAQTDRLRIIDEGHSIATHTYTHPHIDAIAASQVKQEFAQNLAMAQKYLSADFKFTMYRAPFGFPFQANNPNVTWVAPAVAQNGVHIGWGIDTDDWKCALNNQDSNCILNNLQAQLDAGHSGPILMHAVYQLTADTLPQVLAMLKAYGYTIASVEQMIADKYGVDSAAIVAANANQTWTDDATGQFAADECAKNNYIDVPY